MVSDTAAILKLFLATLSLAYFILSLFMNVIFVVCECLEALSPTELRLLLLWGTAEGLNSFYAR